MPAKFSFGTPGTIKRIIRATAAPTSGNQITVPIPAVDLTKSELRYLGGLGGAASTVSSYCFLSSPATVTVVIGNGNTLSFEVTEWA